MLQAEKKVHVEFVTAVMYGEWFYDGTDVSDNDTKLSDKEDDVSEDSKGK